MNKPANEHKMKWFARLGYGARGLIYVVICGLAAMSAIGVGAVPWKHMDIPPGQKRWACPLCQSGLIARGVVWLMIGWFLIQSVFKARAGDIAGMGEALNTLAASPYGDWFLGIVALGLFAFGLYSFLEAAYRRINV